MALAEEYREREDKYEVEPGWALPPLAAALPAGSAVSERTVQMSSQYFDTADHALLEHQVTLRRRSGELDDGWQLKLPAGDSRTEVRVPAEPHPAGPAAADVPAELQELTLGLRAGRPLLPVARLDTERRLIRITDGSAALLAEVADDLVAATVPSRAGAEGAEGAQSADVTEGTEGTGGGSVSVRRWREVEVELGTGDEQLLSAIGTLLTGAGARVSRSSSKLGRALGEFDQPAAGGHHRRPSLADLVGDYLHEQYQALAAGDVGLRQGRTPIHSTRVATRRYRSVLRVFGDLFLPARRDALDAELAWYAGLLGAVRDRQVLRAVLADEVAALPAALVLGPVADTIDAQLAAEQDAALAELVHALSGSRYLALMAELTEWQRRPPLTPAADRRASRVVQYLHRSTRTLDRRLRAAERQPAQQTEPGALSVNQLAHRARKAAKRARYTAELAQPELGKPARRVVRSATRLQDELGGHQDLVVAAETVLRLGSVAELPVPGTGFSYGILYAQLAARAGRPPRRR